MNRATACLGLLLVGLALPAAAETRAETPMEQVQPQPEGFVIQVEEGLVWIDLGERSGVLRGDVFDIISAEIVTHPITGDTLAITPKSVGVIRVVQVFERMSLAEVMRLDEGYDPLLMQVAHISDPEHLAEVENYLQAQAYHAQRSGVPRWQAVVPGLVQVRTGVVTKGWTLMAVEGAALAAGISLRLNSQDWYDVYEHYDGTGQPDKGRAYYDKTFNMARSRRQWSNRCFWLAGAAFAYHCADLLWLGGGTAAHAASLAPPWVALAAGPRGDLQVQMVHRF